MSLRERGKSTRRKVFLIGVREKGNPDNLCLHTCRREAVKSVLRLFDELVKCDEEGVLKGVREVVAGVD
jgi:hypothetical protein